MLHKFSEIIAFASFATERREAEKLYNYGLTERQQKNLLFTATASNFSVYM